MTSIWNTSREVVVYFIWIGKNSPDVLAQYLPLMFPIDRHCVKSVQIWSYFWSVFSSIRSEYEDLRSKSPYSVRIEDNTDQK